MTLGAAQCMQYSSDKVTCLYIPILRDLKSLAADMAECHALK
jgi:hypothetical protein